MHTLRSPPRTCQHGSRHSATERLKEPPSLAAGLGRCLASARLWGARLCPVRACGPAPALRAFGPADPAHPKPSARRGFAPHRPAAGGSPRFPSCHRRPQDPRAACSHGTRTASGGQRRMLHAPIPSRTSRGFSSGTNVSHLFPRERLEISLLEGRPMLAPLSPP